MVKSDALTGPQKAATPRAAAREAPTITLFVLVSLFLLLLLRNGTAAIIADLLSLIPVWYVLVILGAAAFCWAPYDHAAPFIRRFGRASALFLVFFFLTEPFALPVVAVPADHPAVWQQAYGRWIGLALGVAAWFRPAGLFAGAMTVWILRDLNGPITGFHFSNLDIRNVVEVMALIGIGAVLVGAARRQTLIAAYFPITDHMARRILILVLAIGVGGHLGNYFYSAMAKLALDGGPLSWVFGNHLYDGVPGALEKGTFPFAAAPAATQAIYDALKALNLPLHLVSFTAQAAAIIAIRRRRWVMAVTVIYDLFHLAVYFTYGLAFWKWIALNAIILATLARVDDRDWTRSTRAALAGSVLFGAIFFKTATLAWYDTPGFLSPYIEAEMRDGTRVRVPSAFFGSGSYQISHGLLYVPANTDHFNPSIWGSVLNRADRDAGRDCAPPQRTDPAPQKYGPVSRLAAYVWARHDQALAARGDGRGANMYAYPHHHYPSPFADMPFKTADKRDVSAYYLVLESVCLGLENGRLTRDVKVRTEVPLSRPDEKAPL